VIKFLQSYIIKFKIELRKR